MGQIPTQEIYKIVLNDLRGLGLFNGTYDTKNSKSRDFMDGILTVMEFIAYYAGDEGFVDVFYENMLKCENEERENGK